MNPKRYGPYIADRKIGAGGMGTVFLAYHSETGQQVAVKVLPASLAREPGFVPRFEREVEAMKKVQNPNIVEFYESGQTEDGTWYYAMEYVPGETLTARLGRLRRLPWREVVDITTQICSALKAAHNAGVIHRDLKPSNLMLRDDGVVKLTDFGIAHVFASTRLTRTGGVVGTAEYMSPEQASGKRTTKRSDLYSLGAVMYVMLTGRPPFTGETASDIIHKHLYGQFDLPSRYADDMPALLEEVVVRLLEKSAEKRFPDAFVLQRALQELQRRQDFIARGDETQALTDDSVEHDAATRAAETEQLNCSLVDDVAEGGAGGATLMRDLMRVELERGRLETPWAQLFNNTWVLVAMLLLLIAGGFYFVRPAGGLSPQDQFDAGVSLMQKKAGNGWLRARDEYFEPLLEQSPDWTERVTPYLDRIRRYESTRLFARRRPPLRPPADEPTRLMSLAAQQAENGDYATARRHVESLLELVRDNPEYDYVTPIAEELLEELQPASVRDGALDFLARQTSRADSLAAQGDTEAADRIRRSLLDLYADTTDPEIQTVLERCRTKRKPPADSPESPDREEPHDGKAGPS